jgi:hypothetical protein
MRGWSGRVRIRRARRVRSASCSSEPRFDSRRETGPLAVAGGSGFVTGTAVNSSFALVAASGRAPVGDHAACRALIALIVVYRVYNSHRRQYEHLEFLYESMRSFRARMS